MRYTREEKERVLAEFHASGLSQKAFCDRPDEPSRMTLRAWLRLEREGSLAPRPLEVRGRPPDGRRKWSRYPEETRAEAVRLVASGMRPGEAARRLNVPSAGAVRRWVGRASGAGTAPGKGAVRVDDGAAERIRELEAELAEERARNEALREMVCDPKAGDPESLSNSGKAELGERLRAERGWRLRDVLTCLRISKSSYEYARRANERRARRRREVAGEVERAFRASGGTYGYRRVWAALGGAASQREVRAAMRASGLRGRRPRARRARGPCSGEPDARPANVPRERALARREAGEDLGLGHDFSASAPGELAVTDVTESGIPAGKVYLSPVVDCWLGEPAAWGISEHPDKALCEGALGRYLASLPGGSAPVVRTDGGAVYRTGSWKAACEAARATRSMSRKATCPDNARAEGFFGTLREEFFYGRDWSCTPLRAFEEELDGYLRWYVGGRLKRFEEPDGTHVYDTIDHRKRSLSYDGDA